jgi:DNA-binding CsgD family transcriptional regulator
MALRLSNADITRLEHASKVLLAPFSYGNDDAWRRAACRAVEVCLGGDGSSFALPHAGDPMIAAAPDIESALRSPPPPEWIVRGLTVRRRSLGLTVTDWDELFDASAVRRTDYYNDVVRPQGLLAPVVMLAETGLSDLPAALSVYFSDERAAEPHADRRKKMLHLLYPAFCGGLKAFVGFGRNRIALTSLAEDALTGVLFFDGCGRLRRENAFFAQLMVGEPERDRVRAEVTRAARSALSVAALCGSSAAARRTNSDIRTEGARYRVAATFLDEQWAHDSVAIIALVDRVEGKPATARELAEQFSLTDREIETAQLLRSGLSSRQIAADLGISVNTARRHVERVLTKLDVHTRRAAASRLSGN